jgi:hypothetical protein
MHHEKLFLMTSALLFALASGCGGNAKTTSGSGGSAGEGGSTTTTSTGGGGSTTGTTTAGGSGGSTTGTTSSTTSDTTSSTTTSNTTSSTTTTGSSGDATLAVHKMLYGDTDPNGIPSSTAWQQYGFNLDGKVSTANSVDLCKPAQGAKPSSVYPDGKDGIDNGFGKNILPILTSLAADFSMQANDSINAGRFTLLLTIHGIAPGQSGAFPSDLLTASFPDGTFPAWQGTDKWPVRSDSLLNGNLSQPKAAFPMAQVSVDASGKRVWQSSGGADFDLHILTNAFEIVLPIKLARLSMVLSDDNATATQGMIGGVLDTEAFIGELAKTAGSFDASLCPPSATFEAIATQIRQAQDILLDGTQDPAKTCSGISIGLGFSADGALLGAPFDPPTKPNPCK